MEQYAARYRNWYGNETDSDLGSGMAAQHRKDNNDSDDDDNLIQFDHICRAHLAASMQAASVWQAELHAYLKRWRQMFCHPTLMLSNSGRYVLFSSFFTLLLTTVNLRTMPTSIPSLLVSLLMFSQYQHLLFHANTCFRWENRQLITAAPNLGLRSLNNFK